MKYLIFEIFVVLVACFLSYRFGFIAGVEYNYFSKELAQIKIDRCFEIIEKR